MTVRADENNSHCDFRDEQDDAINFQCLTKSVLLMVPNYAVQAA
jgi:hypothetical protein